MPRLIRVYRLQLAPLFKFSLRSNTRLPFKTLTKLLKVYSNDIGAYDRLQNLSLFKFSTFIYGVFQNVCLIFTDPKKLSESLGPAKELVDEAISDLNKSIGLNEMNRQLKMKLDWIQKVFRDLKTSLQG